jgi:hypothetical protein
VVKGSLFLWRYEAAIMMLENRPKMDSSLRILLTGSDLLSEKENTNITLQT